MKRKIALVRTPIVQPYYHITGLRAVPSAGLASLNAALREAGYDSTIVDAPGEALDQFTRIEGTPFVVNGLTADQIVARIPLDADVIGVSCMHTSEWIYDAHILRAIRRAFPGKLLMIGGEHATGATRLVFENAPEVDVAVLGEGEDTALELLDAHFSGRGFGGIAGVAYRERGETRVGPRRATIRDVDRLPFADWTGVPLENYFRHRTCVSASEDRSIPMVATRGCPHACTFCTVPNMWASRWFARSPARVVEEMRVLKEKHRILHVDFVDLTFATNRAWTLEFCKELRAANLGLSWSLPIGTRTEQLDAGVLREMRAAGLKRILFSPESGSKATLLRINKKLKMSDMESAIRGSLDAGLIVKLATIFGFPGQTKREAFQTVAFLWKAALLGVHDAVCLCFVPYPGTVLYDQVVREGLLEPTIDRINLNNDLRNMRSWTRHIPSFAVRYIAIFGMASFYGLQFAVRPARGFVALWRALVRRKPVTNLESMLYSKLARRVRVSPRPEKVGSGQDLADFHPDPGGLVGAQAGVEIVLQDAHH